MKGSALPIGPWSSEVKLLAGTLYNQNDTLNPEPRVPLFTLPTQMNDCLALTEPAALAAPDGFYLALHCAHATNTGSRSVLVKVRNINASSTVLEYKGSLLSSNDVTKFVAQYKFQYPELSSTVTFSGEDLFVKNGLVYLLASPSSNTNYMGCALFKVTNLNTASVQRTGSGAPQMLKYIPGTINTHRGACTYSAQSTASGAALSQYVAGATPFTIVNTGVQLP